MNLNKALHKLKLARKRQNKTAKEIAALRTLIVKLGGNPSPQPNLTVRNKRIYKLYKRGIAYKIIGKYFELTSQRIRSICLRFEVMQGRK